MFQSWLIIKYIKFTSLFPEPETPTSFSVSTFSWFILWLIAIFNQFRWLTWWLIGREAYAWLCVQNIDVSVTHYSSKGILVRWFHVWGSCLIVLVKFNRGSAYIHGSIGQLRLLSVRCLGRSLPPFILKT